LKECTSLSSVGQMERSTALTIGSRSSLRKKIDRLCWRGKVVRVKPQYRRMSARKVLEDLLWGREWWQKRLIRGSSENFSIWSKHLGHTHYLLSNKKNTSMIPAFSTILAIFDRI